MENKYPAAVIRTVTVVTLLLFVVICVGFIPRFADYLTSCDYIAYESRIPVMVGGAALTLPCAVILLMALQLSASGEDRIFTRETAKLLARIAWILAGDCTAFLAVTVIFYCVGDRLIAPLFALIDLIGFVLSYLLWQLSGYIGRAAVLKEEADGTL